jgi:hypothetical protein
VHPDVRWAALAAPYAEVGFARSLLDYEFPDGRLKLLNGHMRRDRDPDREVDVEVLDVNDDEARVLLLSIDPLAALAQTQEQLRDRLLELTPTPTPNANLQAAWEAAANLTFAEPSKPTVWGPRNIAEQYLILVKCRDEKQQVELLERFGREGWECRALLA